MTGQNLYFCSAAGARDDVALGAVTVDDVVVEEDLTVARGLELEYYPETLQRMKKWVTFHPIFPPPHRLKCYANHFVKETILLPVITYNIQCIKQNCLQHLLQLILQNSECLCFDLIKIIVLLILPGAVWLFEETY